ncbi:hypothetical protein MTBLM1_20330 [Rhodospirillaceae bacterium LM-1]|nr:hypothetical protein MTBLM1_20330 [Rhodospirillaceae bacterium LM-1]
MGKIIDYRVDENCKVVVRLANGRERLATNEEWLALWAVDPALTVKLAVCRV